MSADKNFIENLFKTLLHKIPIAVFWKNLDSVFLGCNQHFANYASLLLPEEIIGKTDYDLPWKKFQGDRYRRDDVQIIKNKQPMLNVEEPLTLANGDEIVLLTNKIPILSNEDEVIGILGMSYDITERKWNRYLKRRKIKLKQPVVPKLSLSLMYPMTSALL